MYNDVNKLDYYGSSRMKVLTHYSNISQYDDDGSNSSIGKKIK